MTMPDRPLAERLTEIIRRGRIVDAGTTDDGVQFVQADTGNEWGVSVVRGGISYGRDDGLWEAALTYGAPNYPLAHGVMREHPDWGEMKGWLTPQEVGQVITMVAAYPPPNRKDNN